MSALRHFLMSPTMFFVLVYPHRESPPAVRSCLATQVRLTGNRVVPCLGSSLAGEAPNVAQATAPRAGQGAPSCHASPGLACELPHIMPHRAMPSQGGWQEAPPVAPRLAKASVWHRKSRGRWPGRPSCHHGRRLGGGYQGERRRGRSGEKR